MTQSLDVGDPAPRHVSIYDYPEYYELSFGRDWRPEYRFLLEAAARHGARPVRRVFEPACGTGRILYRLAKSGHDALGIDLNSRAIDYCRERLRRRRLAGWLEVADMTDFQIPRAADLAYILINSFRHLTTEEAAQRHLRAMARAVAPGGLYIMALHLARPGAATAPEEMWKTKRGKLEMVTRLKTVDSDPAGRMERLELTFDIDTSRRTMQLTDDLLLRTYTGEQFLSLVFSVPEWEVAGLYDFRYNLERPIVLDERTEDAVFVLFRRPD